MKEGYVKIKEEGKSITVEFFHPKSNAMSSSMLEQLAGAINQVGGRTDINVIVVKSVGEVFCAGAFFDELLKIDDQSSGDRFFMGFAKVILAIKMAQAIVIVEVQGKSVGGAIGIIAAADYVIASEKALIRLSELTIGIGPFVISPVIKSKISNASFMHVALNPKKWFDASWCLDQGLINETCTHQELAFQVSSKVEELCSYSSDAIQLLKKEGRVCGEEVALDQEMTRLASVSGQLVTSENTKKILKAFIGK